MDVAFSADGRDIITASRDNLSQIWRLENRATPRATFPHMAGPFAAALSPDGAFAASVSYEDGYIWSTENGIEVCQLQGHTEAMRDVNFSHDGAFVVTAAEDRTVRIWNARTCAQVGNPIELPGDSIWSAEFSPDDSTIAIASQAYNDARLYDVRTRTQVHVLIGHTNAVYDAAFSPDGQYVVTGSDDLSARIWTLPPRHALEASTLADTLCEQSLGAGLSVFSDDEIRSAPVLSELDRDPCNPPSLWERVSYIGANTWSGFTARIDAALALGPRTTS